MKTFYLQQAMKPAPFSGDERKFIDDKLHDDHIELKQVQAVNWNPR